MIDDYLAELLAHLRLPDGKRRRVVAEVEDHLACAAADLHAEGLDPDQAEHEAVRRFGPAGELARTFLEQEAARGAMRTAQAATVFALVCGALLIGAPGRSLFAGAFPFSVPAFVLGQVALVAGALTFVRAWRARREGGPRGARLTLVLRGTLVVLGCAAAGIVDALVRALIAGHVWGVGGAAALVALLFGTMATGATLMRSRRKALALPSAPTGPDQDVETLYGALAACVPWLDPRRHPWRFAAIVSAGAGLALAAAHAMTEGGLSLHHLTQQLHGAGLIIGVETAASLLGFAVLGRYLGLRSDTGGAAPGPRSSAAQ